MPNIPRLIPQRTRYPKCSFCSEPVELESSKTDEDGQAMHEECYILKVRGKPAESASTDRWDKGH